MPGDDGLEGQRALAEPADHHVAAGLDALGDGDLALARQQLDAAHLAQVHADRVVGAAEALLVDIAGRAPPPPSLSFSSDRGFGLARRAPRRPRSPRLSTTLMPISLSMARVSSIMLGGDLVRRQRGVQLVVGDVAALLAAGDQLLDRGGLDVEQDALHRFVAALDRIRRRSRPCSPSSAPSRAAAVQPAVWTTGGPHRPAGRLRGRPSPPRRTGLRSRPVFGIAAAQDGQRLAASGSGAAGGRVVGGDQHPLRLGAIVDQLSLAAQQPEEVPAAIQRLLRLGLGRRRRRSSRRDPVAQDTDSPMPHWASWAIKPVESSVSAAPNQASIACRSGAAWPAGRSRPASGSSTSGSNCG